MVVLAASVLFTGCREIERAADRRQDMRIPVSQANPGAALQESLDIAVPASFLRSTAKEAMDSKPEDRDVATPQFPHAGCRCTDTMHELASCMTAVLINAQVLEWKLPPYSRLKRPVREIELHARRSGALVKRLLRAFEMHLPEEARQGSCGLVPCSHGATAAVMAEGPTDGGPVKLPLQMPPPSAPGFPSKTELTSLCDPCTSTFFPKEER